MIPSDLNLEEFAQTFSQQAAEAFPPNLPENLKKFVAQVVYDFVKVAGNALNGEQTNYDGNQTVLICQLIGEWMYHKGIDNFKNEIPEEFWKPILQQIAFAIFEITKKALLENKSQDEIISIVENTVKETYKNLIEQLSQQGKLKKSVDEIMQQSNLNDYVEQSNNQQPQQMPQQEEKDLKMATLALFFKTMSPNDVGKMVKKLNEEERRQILTYMNMDDLEKLVPKNIYNQYLQEFHNFMPKVKDRKRKDAMFSSISGAIKTLDKEKFEKFISYERKNVKNFLLRIYNDKMLEENIFSQELTDTIIEYAVQKVGK